MRWPMAIACRLATFKKYQAALETVSGALSHLCEENAKLQDELDELDETKQADQGSAGNPAV